MLKGTFTIEEIGQLEALDIRGGHGGARNSNNGCNVVAGCACSTTISQTGCTNNDAGCACNDEQEPPEG